MYVVGPLRIDVDGPYVFVEDTEISMSATEMRLLVNLLVHRGRVRSPEALIEEVWGYTPRSGARVVRMFVKRVRDKLGRAGKLIKTVHGVGYRLDDD